MPGGFRPLAPRRLPVPRTKSKPVKKTKKPVKTFQCGQCFTPGHKLRKDTFVLNFKKLCVGCAGEFHPTVEVKIKPVTKKQVKAEIDSQIGWFVLQVEPDMESRVKQDILRKVRINSLGAFVKKLLIPKRFEEVIATKKGEVVERGEAGDPHTAHVQAHKKCQELAGQAEDEPGPDGAGATPGFRYSVFRAPGKEKGREGNGWAWTVRTVPKDRERRVIQVRKYPGYVICQLAYTEEIAKLVSKVRGAWGFLLRPVVLGHRVRVKESESQFKPGWWWYLVHPDTGETVEKGKEKTEEAAKYAGERRKAEVEVFRPTGLKSKEAAELLISQKAVNQIAKDPAEKNRAFVTVKVGQTVNIHDGAFRNCKGVVTKIDNKDKTCPLVTVKVELLGQQLEVSVPCWEVR